MREIGAGEELCANYIDSFEVRGERERNKNKSLIDAFIGHLVTLQRETEKIEKMAFYLHLRDLLTGTSQTGGK